MSRVKQPQVLNIDPQNELRFQGPFNDVVTATLKLDNPSDKKVCFKVKTTAPKRYCVRPNSGVIDPQGTVNVSVMLQPIASDASDKGKHKFMVQSMYAPENIDDLEKLWADASSTDLMDSKLRCVFEESDPLPGDSVQMEAADSTDSGLAENEQDKKKAELHLLMEECKRLQAENSKQKQQNDEYKSELDAHYRARVQTQGMEAILNTVKANLLIVCLLLLGIFSFGAIVGKVY